MLKTFYKQTRRTNKQAIYYPKLFIMLQKSQYTKNTKYTKCKIFTINYQQILQIYFHTPTMSINGLTST